MYSIYSVYSLPFSAWYRAFSFDDDDYPNDYINFLAWKSDFQKDEKGEGKKRNKKFCKKKKKKD